MKVYQHLCKANQGGGGPCHAGKLGFRGFLGRSGAIRGFRRAVILMNTTIIRFSIRRKKNNIMNAQTWYE